MAKVQAIFIAGPTASGKSAAAARLARALGGAVVNADSMQVYRELRVLTARPGPADEAEAPHHLYGFVPVTEAYSAGKWARDAAEVLARLRRDSILPIVAGGTGLYFSALENGLSPVPEVSREIRAAARARCEALGNESFYRELQERDPRTAAQLSPGDTQRVIRAWEVFEETGQGLAEWQEVKGEPLLPPGRMARFVVHPPREALYAACDARFEAMLDAGALEEARAIAAMKLDPILPATRALGLAQLVALAEGRMGREEAVAEAKRKTRNYAKRQVTWFRNQMKDWAQLEGMGAETIAGAVLAAL